MRRAAALLTAATLALAGCGAGSGGDPQSTVRDYLNAFVKGDGAKACSLMSSQTRKQFVSRARRVTRTGDCASSVETIQAQAGSTVLDALKKTKISDVKVTGSRATAKLASGVSTTVTQLQKEGGSWKITGAPGTQ
jgi:hypothetical protein